MSDFGSDRSSDEDRLQFLDDTTPLALQEMLALSGFTLAELMALVEHGAFEPQGATVETWIFSARTVFIARRAAGLRNEFGLDTPGTSLVLGLLERIEALERRLRELEQP